MTLQQLRYLVEIAKSSSISQAAQNLYVTQPSVSKAVKELENELNIVIFERINRGIQFTSDGMELLCYAKELLEKAENIESRFLSNPSDKPFQFAISAQHYVFTAAAFIEFINQQSSPDYKLFMREGKTSEVIKDIFNQRSELGIIALPTKAERFMLRVLNSKGIEFHLIQAMKPHAFLSREHPLAACAQVSTAQLAKYPCLSYEQDNSNHNFAEEVLTVDKPRQAVYVTDRATMNNIISHSLCYNIGTGCLLDGIIEDSIISVPIEGQRDVMNVGWIKLKNSVMSPAMTGFVDMLTSSFHQCIYGRR
ncbi:MAG: LysR family transcriptional regulator [Peptococcaceae bacterium]|nr:LysR family transcriptional regulator [Peptococcaceae bacterium]